MDIKEHQFTGTPINQHIINLYSRTMAFRFILNNICLNDRYMKMCQKNTKSSDKILEDSGYTFRHMEKNKMFEYAEDFRTIYNKAWVTHSNFKGMPETQARSIMRKLKPVMDPELIWFAYYNEEPVGFFIGLPELNQVFKYINGNLNWWGKLKFLLHQKEVLCNNVFGTAFGIVPEHQRKGLEGAIIMNVKKQFEIRRKKYQKLL